VRHPSLSWYFTLWALLHVYSGPGIKRPWLALCGPSQLWLVSLGINGPLNHLHKVDVSWTNHLPPIFPSQLTSFCEWGLMESVTTPQASCHKLPSPSPLPLPTDLLKCPFHCILSNSSPPSMLHTSGEGMSQWQAVYGLMSYNNEEQTKDGTQYMCVHISSGFNCLSLDQCHSPSSFPPASASRSLSMMECDIE